MVDPRVRGKSEGLDEPYPVISHLIDTAWVCGAVWDRVLGAARREIIANALGLSAADARATVMFWAGLHDLGKIMPQFQDMILKKRPTHCSFLAEAQYAHDRDADSKTNRIRHEHATHAALPSLLAALGYPRSGRSSALLLTQIAQVLGGHHGRYPRDNDPQHLRDPLQRMPELGTGEWAVQRKKHVQALYDVLGRPPIPRSRAVPVTEAVVIAGMVIVSDWIASQEHVITGQQKAAAGSVDSGSLPDLKTHARRIEGLAPGLLDEAGLGNAAFRNGGFRDLFPDIEIPHPLQLSVEQGLAKAQLAGPGILLVTAPTGEGKTETALYAASLMGEASGSVGLFLALPTQATANQMYGRLVDFAERNLLTPSQLTLLHGAADLYAPYAEAQPATPELDTVEPRVLSDHDPTDSRDARISVETSRWLRAQGRGILAPLAVGTIDQALMGVLPLKRNALRHLGLAGKTVIIDEAHAYDTYTHALLLRLLEWLGALGVPVVLLSATLTGETARGMVRAYLSGANPSGVSRELPAPAYPGWIYSSADGSRLIEPAEPIVSEQRRDLDVALRTVQHTYDPDIANGRLTVLLETLENVATTGGCAAVICTTVAEAQKTYEALRAHYQARYGDSYLGWDDRAKGDRGCRDSAARPHLRLLHARFPAGGRASITAEVESWFGRTDKRGTRRPTGPRGAVLVATQVIEQSLDLDFDLVVSDLAPMAMLLQRAGRVWRHRKPAPPRPAWARGPRLVVLAPVGEKSELAVPVSWGEVYDPALLQRTLELLEQRKDASIAIPEDVQRLVDGVYAENFPSVAPEKLMERDFKRLAEDMARTALADMAALPKPSRVTSLHALTTSDVDEELVRTRLGSDSVQVLPVFDDGTGQWLDEECTQPLPLSGSGRDGRFTVREVRELLSHVAPLSHGSWRAACGTPHQPPAGWRKEPRLARLVLLPHRVDGEGRVEGATVGDTRITYDRALGLVAERLV
ncbi:CRISPR-associated endonuclease Cas3'' [Streptomyces sp. UNOC14_S4]|uniref:CRISPR-associated endonuclease Cas3'' n=1 Tax=Streptomyces sp. UNOC14_S4 TaxID=2872340 RepID=UPI001E600D36|nr:CRISPR-associated endonuclease Cas3'' [Streptomyces sp. UNOC14_S4]MCC3768633.1 CRISPR-associated endonuclease Cas3'' [Streptomyces sp. UNOC14_S4]